MATVAASRGSTASGGLSSSWANPAAIWTLLARISAYNAPSIRGTRAARLDGSVAMVWVGAVGLSVMVDSIIRT